MGAAVLAASVTNAMSTTALSANGLYNTSTARAVGFFSVAVAESGTNHSALAVDAHGARSKPVGPLTECSTTTPPPDNSTVALAYAAFGTSSPSRNSLRAYGGSVTRREPVGPWVAGATREPTALMDATRSTSVVLISTTR